MACKGTCIYFYCCFVSERAQFGIFSLPAHLPATSSMMCACSALSAGAAILAKVRDLDMSKFQDEDQEEEPKPERMMKQHKPVKKEEKKKASGG